MLPSISMAAAFPTSNKVDSATSGGHWSSALSQPAGRGDRASQSITEPWRCRHTLPSITSVCIIHVDPNKAVEMQISCLRPHLHAPNLPVLLSARPLGLVGDVWWILAGDEAPGLVLG